MRKLFLLLVFAFYISIIMPMEYAEAADVPDFMDVAGDKASYYGVEHSSSERGVCDIYQYWMSIDDGEDLAYEYTRLLLKNYPFIFIGGFQNDYISTSAQFFETALFDYIGSKNINSFIRRDVERKSQYSCKLYISIQENFSEGRTICFIGVAQGLTYAGGQ